MITGNKGEWSEIYVLFRLLSDGKIFAANENLKKIERSYFPIIKIIREEISEKRYEYSIGEKIRVYFNGNLVNEIDRARFSSEADYLFRKIAEGSERAFSVEETEKFMCEIGCHRLAAPSCDKTDITLQLHDIQTSHEIICGFSIKSEIGNSPTLINATGATNFIFEVTGLSDKDINEINAIETRTKIKDRMERIFSLADDISFCKISSSIFERNLMLIDSRLTELVAYSLLYHYRDGIATCEDVINLLEALDPMEFPADGFYRYKFKKFLCSAALGMTPAKTWDGLDEANGGYIVVTQAGEVLAYHIYNRNYFEEYLLKHTRFERASTTRHGFASLYKENGKVYVKLNLQVRFK